MKKEILSAVASYREELVRFTSELVGIPTENPPGHFYRDCVEAISAKLGELGLDSRIHDVIPASGNEFLRFHLEDEEVELPVVAWVVQQDGLRPVIPWKSKAVTWSYFETANTEAGNYVEFIKIGSGLTDG